jgi:hypothetical protein
MSNIELNTSEFWQDCSSSAADFLPVSGPRGRRRDSWGGARNLQMLLDDPPGKAVLAEFLPLARGRLAEVAALLDHAR